VPVHHLDIVTLGWDLPGWLGKFYPEDLPPEWRLTYFANEFPAVLIPLRLWAGADVRQMRRWAGDVHQNFRFYLELPARADPAAFGSKIAALGNKLCGLVGIGEGGNALPSAFFRWQEDASGPEAGLPAAYRVPGMEMDLRADRAWLESIARRQKGAPGLIVIDRGSVGPDGLRRWLNLAWLLGVA